MPEQVRHDDGGKMRLPSPRHEPVPREDRLARIQHQEPPKPFGIAARRGPQPRPRIADRRMARPGEGPHHAHLGHAPPVGRIDDAERRRPELDQRQPPAPDYRGADPRTPPPPYPQTPPPPLAC